jgi:uncharacterized protein YhbP (UPF0306 family)
MEHNLEKLVQEVLRDGFVINLGTVDDDGSWVASVVYVFDEKLNLYWVFQPSTRHSAAITKNPKVAGNIVADFHTDKERALQVEGTAEVLSGTSIEREQELQKKRGMAMPSQAGEILEGGYQWYKFIPTRIELIYNELFGYDRKRFL